MTLPYEQYNSLVNTRNFLFSLLDPKKTKVPSSIREEARRHLKHFPFECEIDQMIGNHVERCHEIDQSTNKVWHSDPVTYSPSKGGWIFWDEASVNFHGPFLTRNEAQTALKEYCETL